MPTVEELNKALLDIIDDLESPPSGAKHFIFKNISGVAASEQAAKLHAPRMLQYNLKTNFESIGVFLQVAPALLAGMGSRESDMGAALQSSKSIYWGWGDKSIRKKSGEKVATYHGFGVLQLDRIKCPIKEARKILNESLGKKQLNPYDYQWLKWGAETFTTKLAQAGDAYPTLKSPEQFATALSKYNGGHKKLYYPKNDYYTTQHDYAGDTMARARWYSKNWGTI